jgi:hypothetical protein
MILTIAVLMVLSQYAMGYDAGLYSDRISGQLGVNDIDDA